jgi:transcriptional regulator with XRE-family HTH domain
MLFGRFLKEKRMETELNLRDVAMQSGINVIRLSLLEREISSTPPTEQELTQIQMAYKIKEFSCDKYKFNEANFKEDQRFQEMIKDESPADLLKKHGIFACKIG